MRLPLPNDGKFSVATSKQFAAAVWSTHDREMNCLMDRLAFRMVSIDVTPSDRKKGNEYTAEYFASLLACM